MDTSERELYVWPRTFLDENPIADPWPDVRLADRYLEIKPTADPRAIDFTRVVALPDRWRDPRPRRRRVWDWFNGIDPPRSPGPEYAVEQVTAAVESVACYQAAPRGWFDAADTDDRLRFMAAVRRGLTGLLDLKLCDHLLALDDAQRVTVDRRQPPHFSLEVADRLVRRRHAEPSALLVNPTDIPSPPWIEDGWTTNTWFPEPLDYNGRWLPGERIAPGFWNGLSIIPVPIRPGTAIVGAFGRADDLYRVGDERFRIAEQHGEFFIRNLEAGLLEQRIAHAIKDPEAFVIVQAR